VRIGYALLTVLVLGRAIALAQPATNDAGTDAALTTEQQSAYYGIVTQAIAEFDAAHFEEARALFRRAHELWPSARTWRTLGMTAFELRMYPQAQAELQAALDDPRRPLDDTQREQLGALLERTRAYVGCYKLDVEPSEAELLLDGTPLRLDEVSTVVLAVGRHELLARAPGYVELRVPLEVEGGEDEARSLRLAALPVAPPPEPAPPTLMPVRDLQRDPWLPSARWVAGSVAGAGVVSAVVLGALAIDRKNTLDQHCWDGACPRAYWHDLDQLQRFSRASTAGIVVGAAGASALTYLLLRPRLRRVAWSPLGLRGVF
jgi:hypothetical protein